MERVKFLFNFLLLEVMTSEESFIRSEYTRLQKNRAKRMPYTTVYLPSLMKCKFVALDSVFRPRPHSKKYGRNIITWTLILRETTNYKFLPNFCSKGQLILGSLRLLLFQQFIVLIPLQHRFCKQILCHDPTYPYIKNLSAHFIFQSRKSFLFVKPKN